jgi:glyoxylase-like metal-dependent hydrolase (beta-lactamase superfamily II)
MFRGILVAIGACVLVSACAARLSTHPTEAATIGAPISSSQMLEKLQQPGIVSFEQVAAADWRWSEAFATPGVTPPDWRNEEFQGQVYFYKVRHPTRGLVLIDAGLPADTVRHLGPIVRNVFDIEHTFAMRQSTAAALAGETPSAVFITHLHWDHVLGARDLPRDTPIYAGPGDGAMRHFLLRFIAPVTRRALERRPPLREWRFSADPDGRTAGAIDVFGDGSIFAVSAPGHTPGSTAYFVNAVDGVHLITGDAIHTAAGWRGERVEYITFDPDRARAWESLAQLQALARAIPGIIVHPGHQRLAPG